MEYYEYDNENFLSIIKEAMEDYGVVKQTRIDDERVLVVTLTNGQRFIIVTREVTEMLGRDYN